MPKTSRIRQVIEGDAMDAASVRQGMCNHSCAINAAGHAKDGHHFHLLSRVLAVKLRVLGVLNISQVQRVQKRCRSECSP